MKFKVGDRVRVVKPLLNVKAALGKEATIETAWKGMFYLCFDEPVPHDTDAGNHHWFAHDEDMIELVPRFKVGDRVRYIGMTSPYASGEVGTVQDALDFNSVLVSWDNQSRPLPCGVYGSNLEVIEPEKPQPKVGEFVVWMGEFHRVVQIDTTITITVEDGKGQIFVIEAADVEPIRDAA